MKNHMVTRAAGPAQQQGSRQQAQLFQPPRVQRLRLRCSCRCRRGVPVCHFANHDVVVAMVDRLRGKPQLHPAQAVILRCSRPVGQLCMRTAPMSWIAAAHTPLKQSSGAEKHCTHAPAANEAAAGVSQHQHIRFSQRTSSGTPSAARRLTPNPRRASSASLSTSRPLVRPSSSNSSACCSPKICSGGAFCRDAAG